VSGEDFTRWYRATRGQLVSGFKVIGVVGSGLGLGVGEESRVAIVRRIEIAPIVLISPSFLLQAVL